MGSSPLLCATSARPLRSRQSASPSAIQCLGAPSENLWQIGKQLPRNNGPMVPSLLSILLTRCGGKTLTISSLSDTNGRRFVLTSTAPPLHGVRREMEASIPLQHGLQVRRFRHSAPHHRFCRPFARGTHSEGFARATPPQLSISSNCPANSPLSTTNWTSFLLFTLAASSTNQSLPHRTIVLVELLPVPPIQRGSPVPPRRH